MNFLIHMGLLFAIHWVLSKCICRNFHWISNRISWSWSNDRGVWPTLAGPLTPRVMRRSLKYHVTLGSGLPQTSHSKSTKSTCAGLAIHSYNLLLSLNCGGPGKFKKNMVITKDLKNLVCHWEIQKSCPWINNKLNMYNCMQIMVYDNLIFEVAMSGKK